jgi:AcrR family transcriptional regulator
MAKAKSSLSSIPKPGRREKTELALLTAAGHIFSQKGYETTTTKEIAEKAGCAEALIHRYFGGKNGLLTAVVKNGKIKAPTIDIAALPFKSTLGEEISQLFEATAANLKARSEHIRIVFSRALVDPSFDDFKKIVMRPERLATVEKRFQHYQEQGLIAKNVKIAGATEMFLGLIFQLSFVHREVMCIRKDEYEEKVVSFCEIFAKGIEANPLVKRRETSAKMKSTN